MCIYKYGYPVYTYIGIRMSGMGLPIYKERERERWECEDICIWASPYIYIHDDTPYIWISLYIYTDIPIHKYIHIYTYIYRYRDANPYI